MTPYEVWYHHLIYFTSDSMDSMDSMESMDSMDSMESMGTLFTWRPGSHLCNIDAYIVHTSIKVPL